MTGDAATTGACHGHARVAVRLAARLRATLRPTGRAPEKSTK